jgi:diguanylate cyclase (GGDEF)-like protein/PAS domain S-box-containing protein
MAGKSTAPLSLSAWQVIQAMHDGVVITDPNGTIRAVNRAFCAVTGYTRHEVIGKNPRMLHSGKHGRAFYAHMWSSIERGGCWQGEIWNRRKNGAVYPEWLTISKVKDPRGHTRCYLGVFRDITNPKLNEDRLKHLAHYDPLTGLPNRRLLNERLSLALKRRHPGRRLAVLFLDIDHFKDINDRWGHAAGDIFLRAVGARLRGCVRRTDTVARWAGDEFAVLLNPISGRGDAERVAKKILRVLHRPFRLNDRRVLTSASIGGCMLEGKSTPRQLLRKADGAMYEVKKHRRNDVRFWTRGKRPGPGPSRTQAVSLHRTSAPGTNGRASRPGATVPLRERAPQKPHSRTGKRRRPRPVGVHETAIRRA